MALINSLLKIFVQMGCLAHGTYTPGFKLSTPVIHVDTHLLDHNIGQEINIRDKTQGKRSRGQRTRKSCFVCGRHTNDIGMSKMGKANVSMEL